MCHKPKHFWARGDKWRPKWLVQSAAKYNVVHPNNKTDPGYINKGPPLPFARPTSNDAVTFLDKLDLEYESPNKEFHEAAEEVSDSQNKYVPQSLLAGIASGPMTSVKDYNPFSFLQDWDKISNGL